MPRFSFADLATAIVAAPMAGGPSTPRLVRAVADAGGLGCLAAGYLTPDALADQLVDVSGVPHGVNVFVPEREQDLAAAAAFRERLVPLAARYRVQLPQPFLDDDAYAAKLELLLDAAPAVASFTFGCPTPEVVRALHGRGSAVVVTVTNPDDARVAAAVGADALSVQGPEAGGHRSTFRAADDPDTRPLLDLLAAVRGVVDIPLVAAGGLSTPESVAAVRRAGAVAAQCGTAFVLTDEAGTNPTHRAALRDAAFDHTVSTRAFSGRYARGLANAWTRDFAAAPAAYPALNQVTSPLRKAAAAAGDAQHTHLWAGAGWRDARPGAAAEVVAWLAEAGAPRGGTCQDRRHG